MRFLIENSYFTICNVLFLQTVVISMGIDPALFWTNLYWQNYESRYITNLVKTNNLRSRRFHSTFLLIGDLSPLNVGGEFGKAFFEIYPAELELKVEHNDSHATFLSLDISIDKRKFMFDKRYAFNLHIVRIPSITSNFLPSISFYSSTMSEF